MNGIRRAVPYETIAQMYHEGTSYEQIAKATNRYNDHTSDPTKEVRAIIHKMIHKGFTVNGQQFQLQPRERGRVQEIKAPSKPRAVAVAAGPKRKPGRPKATVQRVVRIPSRVVQQVEGSMEEQPEEPLAPGMIRILIPAQTIVMPLSALQQHVAPAPVVAEAKQEPVAEAEPEPTPAEPVEDPAALVEQAKAIAAQVTETPVIEAEPKAKKVTATAKAKKSRVKTTNKAQEQPAA